MRNPGARRRGISGSRNAKGTQVIPSVVSSMLMRIRVMLGMRR